LWKTRDHTFYETQKKTTNRTLREHHVKRFSILMSLQIIISNVKMLKIDRSVILQRAHIILKIFRQNSGSGGLDR